MKKRTEKIKSIARPHASLTDHTHVHKYYNHYTCCYDSKELWLANTMLITTDIYVDLYRLRVTCDDTHLHFIHGHQFIDSPEWEANHEQSDDVFQVTITAEEDSVYLCWPRMKLERVLRHRPLLKIVMDSIIGEFFILLVFLLAVFVSVSVSVEVDSLPWKTSGCPSLTKLLNMDCNNLWSNLADIHAKFLDFLDQIRSLKKFNYKNYP